jgi:hypothetical protein
MQRNENGQMFCAGALEIKGKNNSEWNRKSQCSTKGNTWRYVFLAVASKSLKDEVGNLYSAEAILHGRLCEAFRGIKNSHFKADSDKEVKEVAPKAVKTFNSAQQYGAPPSDELGVFGGAILFKRNAALYLAQRRQVLAPVVQLRGARISVVGHILCGFECSAVMQKHMMPVPRNV